VLWDPKRKVSLTNSILHHNCDYTPYEGRELTGYPVMTLSRGEVVMEEAKMSGSAGRGRFQKCDRPSRPPARPAADRSLDLQLSRRCHPGRTEGSHAGRKRR
jgi:dihydropyrimidinase